MPSNRKGETCPCVPVYNCSHSACCCLVSPAPCVVTWKKKKKIYLCVILPSCGLFWGGRAKHQKLKTGNDQSPGDKKTEMEADQSMFNQALIVLSLGNKKSSTSGASFDTALLFNASQTICSSALFFFIFSVVPNGPGESDSEPANQMSWKEGRQLLRK